MSDSSHIPSHRSLTLAFIALLLLLGAAILPLWLPDGPWQPIYAMSVAGLKALIVILIFMRARSHRGASLLFIVSGFAWLAILFTLTFADYWTR